MGWLISALLALLVVSLLAVVMPALFGPVVAGVAPLLVVVALIGIGGIWWRRSRSRIDPDRPERPDRPDADTAAGRRPPADPEPEPLRAEDDRVET